MAETDASHRDDTGYEHSDAPPALVAKLAAGLAITIMAVSLLLVIIFPGAPGHRARQPTLMPPTPRLQANEFRDLAALRRSEDARLGTYGWIDRDHGTVRIPIEQAMRIVAERGVPDWPKAGN